MCIGAATSQAFQGPIAAGRAFTQRTGQSVNPLNPNFNQIVGLNPSQRPAPQQQTQGGSLLGSRRGRGETGTLLGTGARGR